MGKKNCSMEINKSGYFHQLIVIFTSMFLRKKGAKGDIKAFSVDLIGQYIQATN